MKNMVTLKWKSLLETPAALTRWPLQAHCPTALPHSVCPHSRTPVRGARLRGENLRPEPGAPLSFKCSTAS